MQSARWASEAAWGVAGAAGHVLFMCTQESVLAYNASLACPLPMTVASTTRLLADAAAGGWGGTSVERPVGPMRVLGVRTEVAEGRGGQGRGSRCSWEVSETGSRGQ